MELPLLKTLLRSSDYKANQSKLKRSIFSDDAAELYDLLDMAHAKYSHDLTPDEVYALWIADHPVATNTEKADFQDLLDDVQRSEALSEDIAQDVISKLHRREIGREITSLGINLSEGDTSAMGLLKALLDRVADSYNPDDFGPTTSKELDELLAISSDENRWQFNINSLSRHLYGIGAGEFMIVLARPETGKTSFLVSLMAGPGGFCDQGARVLYLGNEEATERTMLRAVQSASGMTRQQIADDPKTAMAAFTCAKANLEMKSVVDWDLDRVEAYVHKMKPNVLVIDQSDKVGVSGQYQATHERLRELYRRIRELAKRHNCALIGVSQASNDAEGKTRVTYAMAEGSKTGKGAEADVILGIGKHSGDNEDGEQDNTRFLTISKNKLSGYHGTIAVMMEPDIARYNS
jgi:KaiC/GvpD/RAD55 family RecA-like ATPase